jgi:hypothetical protein
MRIDPKSTTEVAANSKHITTSGFLVAWLVEPGVVYIHDKNSKRVLATGDRIRCEVPPGAEISSDKKMAVRTARSEPVQPSGEVFTNFDKRPGQSPIEQAIRRMERKRMLLDRAEREMRAAQDREMLARHSVEVDEDKAPPPPPPPPDDPSAQPTEPADPPNEPVNP